jgi:hypothetical protein
MRCCLYILILSLLLQACKQQQVPEKKWPDLKDAERLITDSSWGPVTSTTDFDSLKKMFPAYAVSDEKICARPWCEDSITTTKVWDHHRFIIFWKEGQFHKQIAYIRSYAGDYYYTTNDSGKTTHNYPYITSTGINCSTTLTELVKKNGKRIDFCGFFGDSSGLILSYNGGALANSPIQLSLSLKKARPITKKEFRSLMLDEMHTDLPLVKRVIDNIVVGEISLSFIKATPPFRPNREFGIAYSGKN